MCAKFGEFVSMFMGLDLGSKTRKSKREQYNYNRTENNKNNKNNNIFM